MNEDVSPCKHPLTAPTPWGVRKLFCDKTLLHLIIIIVTVSPVICAMQLDTCALPGPSEDLPLPHSREPKWTGPFVRALTWLVVPGRKGGEARTMVAQGLRVPLNHPPGFVPPALWWPIQEVAAPPKRWKKVHILDSCFMGVCCPCSLWAISGKPRSQAPLHTCSQQLGAAFMDKNLYRPWAEWACSCLFVLLYCGKYT